METIWPSREECWNGQLEPFISSFMDHESKSKESDELNKNFIHATETMIQELGKGLQDPSYK